VDLELGAALSRHDVSITLAGRGARCEAGGILLADGRRHLDTRLTVTHAAADTACDLPWRGLAADRARLAFLGAITILEGADGSDARLSCKNLLLSEGAEVDAQPVLEIHADEVKAAHGATVGRLDATSLFYLRSRGIPEAQARAMLTQAFCREALGPIAGDEEALAQVSPRLEARLLATEAA
jgi:Fe-S cluster assembly protein SufD